MAQNHQPVGDLGDHGKIVRDVERRSAVLADRVAQQAQHLDLGGHVQRRRRLVQHEDVGFAGHGQRHHGALQLPAGDLMRIAFAEALGLVQAQRGEELHHPGAGLALGHQPVVERRLDDLLFQPVRGVEGRGGALRHIGDPGAAHRLAVASARRGQIAARKPHLAAGDPAAAPAIAHGCQPDGRFARAAFTDQAEDLALFEVERYAVQQFVTRSGRHPQVADLKNLVTHRLSPCTVVWPASIQ